MMNDAITFGLGDAWKLALEEAGIDPETMTGNEVVALDQFMAKERGFLGELLRYIVIMILLRKPLEAVINRVKTWAFRWWESWNLALLTTPNDPNLEWMYGATLEHCTDCAGYNGAVKPASYWNQIGARPQLPSLACKGWKCDCHLNPTKKKITKGELNPPSGS
jgi:hypothetical protein